MNVLYKIAHNRVFLYLGEHGAELNYMLGTSITDLTNLKNGIRYIELSDLTKTVIIVGWNYLDAAYDFMFALSLLTNKDNYRARQNTIKGIINIVGGIELFVFSYNPPLTNTLGLADPTALAGISFALAMFCDLVAASIDFHSLKQETLFQSWLLEKIKEYQFTLLHNMDNKKCVKDIRARCRAYVNGDPAKATLIIQLMGKALAKEPNSEAQLELLTKKLNVVTSQQQERDQNIQEHLDQAYKANRTFLAMKTLSAVGMTLLAVVGFLDNATDDYPIVFATGLAVTTFVGSYYCITNAERLTNTVSSCYHQFFPVSKDIKSLELVKIDAPALGA
jgi:hypothetical protein